MKTSIRVHRNGGKKAGLSQARKTRNPNPATTETLALPKWLNLQREALLDILRANKTKFGFQAKTIMHLLKHYGFELSEGECLAELKKLASLTPPHAAVNRSGWRITAVGRKALGLLNLPKSAHDGSVTIVMTYPDGRVFAEAELPKALHDGAQRAAKRLGITFAEFSLQAMESFLGIKRGLKGGVR